MMTNTTTTETTYIRSNRNDAGIWHIGVRYECRGAVTGKVFSVGYKTRCTSKQLGGAWGYEETRNVPANDQVCARCVALTSK